MSPDGQRIAFTGRDANDETRIYVRDIDALEAKPIGGTENAILPFWSPDGRRLAFCQGQKLRHVAVGGGGATDVADCPNPRTHGAWGTDGTILFVPDYQGPLMRVSANGGAVEQVLAGGWANASFSFYSPVWLRDGRRFLVAKFSYAEGTDEEGAYVGTIGSAEAVGVTSGQTQEIAIAGGELYLRRGDNLLVQTFDETSATVSGQVRTVASSVVAFAAAGDTLAYYTRPHGLLQNQKVRWFGRDGTVLGDTAEGGTYRDVRVSPDGRLLALLRTNPRGLGEIWTYDLSRQIDSPAISGVSAFNPVWLPDGRSLVAGTGRGLMRARIGDPTPQPLFTNEPAAAVPEDISRDGKHLLYVPIETGSARLMVRALDEASPARQVGPTTARLGATGVFSPDGRWIVYSISDGTAPRLYATPFPALDSRVPVTAVNGVRPRWRRDGGELFFLTSMRGPTAMEERRMMSVPVSWTPDGPEFGRAQPLFVVHGVTIATAGSFDVSADGQRFVFVVDSERDRSPIVVYVRRE